jgi:hypothetical protein
MLFLRSIPFECLSLIFHRSNYASRCNPENLCDVYKGTRNDFKVQGGNDVALLRLTGPCRELRFSYVRKWIMAYGREETGLMNCWVRKWNVMPGGGFRD